MLQRLSKFSIPAFQILLGVAAATLGLKGFLLPNHFIDGGVTGISILASIVLDIPLAFLIPIINAPFLIMGYFMIGRNFFFTAVCSIIALSTALYFVPIPIITVDSVLSATFGGFFVGAGIGFAIRGNSVLDGTEVLALLLGRKTNFIVADIILFMNIIIFISGIYFLGIESVLYSILAYGAAALTIKYLLKGLEEHVGVFIISQHTARIKVLCHEELSRSTTIFKGKGGYRGSELEILFCVIVRLEINHLKEIIHRIDPDAFVVFQSINETSGGMMKKGKSLIHG